MSTSVLIEEWDTKFGKLENNIDLFLEQKVMKRATRSNHVY